MPPKSTQRASWKANPEHELILVEALLVDRAVTADTLHKIPALALRYDSNQLYTKLQTYKGVSDAVLEKLRDDLKAQLAKGSRRARQDDLNEEGAQSLIHRLYQGRVSATDDDKKTKKKEEEEEEVVEEEDSDDAARKSKKRKTKKTKTPKSKKAKKSKHRRHVSSTESSASDYEEESSSYSPSSSGTTSSSSEESSDEDVKPNRKRSRRAHHHRRHGRTQSRIERIPSALAIGHVNPVIQGDVVPNVVPSNEDHLTYRWVSSFGFKWCILFDIANNHDVIITMDRKEGAFVGVEINRKVAELKDCIRKQTKALPSSMATICELIVKDVILLDDDIMGMPPHRINDPDSGLIFLRFPTKDSGQTSSAPAINIF